MKTSRKTLTVLMLVVGLALLGGLTTVVLAGTFAPITVTDQTPAAPLANPVPSSFQPRYISGFGSDNSFTVFFEDRDAGNKISYASTTSGPTGFPASATATNIVDTHFCVKDWPINIGGTDYAYRAWGSVSNNMDHHFYVSNDLTNWTLVSTFTIPNAPGFTDAHGWVYYGFHDVIDLNGTYYAFAESNQSQTMIVSSANGDDVWEAFASVGGRPGWGPLELPAGVYYGWTPSGNFVDLGHDRGYGKIHVDPRDNNFYLAVNTAAKASLPPADLEAAFINPANWTWHDGTTGPAANPILPATSEHDLRECWVVPNTNPDADWVIIYDADFGSADGGKALGYATLTPPIPPPAIVYVDDNYDATRCTADGHTWQVDCFDVIQDGVNAVASGGTVHVAAGTYDSSVETPPININKPLTLFGAQANVDPRPSQGSRTGSESIVDADETSSAVMRISASDVEISGFTITGGTGDMVEESGSADNLLFRYNILYDDLATCTPGDEAIQIKYSDGVVIEYNYAHNICEDAFNLSSSSNGVVRYNEAHDIYSQNAAIYCYDATNIDIIGNLVYNVPNNDGIKLGDSDDGSTGGIVEGNEVHDAAEDGITIYASGVAVENNTIYNCDSENGALYLYGADNSTITNNRIYNNDAIGLLIRKSSNVTVSENNIYDNDDTNDTKYIDSSGIWLTSDASTIGINNNCITGNADFGVKNEATTVINAENDWWGDASGPFHTTSNPSGTGNAVSDGVDFDPWLIAPIESVCPPPDDEGPITSNVVATPNPAPVNTAIVLTANVDDSTTGSSNIASAEYNIDGGSFVAMNAQDGGFDEVSEDVEATAPAFAEAGIHEVCVHGTDAAGNVGSETCIMLSVNAPPSVNAGGPYAGNEGSPIPLTGFVDDPDGPSLTTTWTYVPVANVDEGAICEFGDANALATTFNCTDDGTYRVTLTGNDGINSPVEASADVTVHNVEPEVTIINPVDGDLFAVDTTVNLSAAFTDASINDTHTCLIRWDSGTPEPGTVSEDNGAGTCDGSHLYSAAGVYAIQVTVTDDDGGDTTESVMVVVYDPEGGFVTGGGWIDSPKGAYVPDPSLTGKATFGFVSKYKKGAQTPEGQTEFVFKVADLNFHSSSYDWLVVNQGGTRAQFKGWGTINGEGDYRFMLWAGDDDPDTFRIKIWEEVDGVETVVYDNGVQQPIGGGSIVVHKK